jgi:hypothetical protein
MLSLESCRCVRMWDLICLWMIFICLWKWDLNGCVCVWWPGPYHCENVLINVLLLHLLWGTVILTRGSVLAAWRMVLLLGLHCCRWRGQNLEESSILKHSKVSWINSLRLNLYLHAIFLLVEIRGCSLLLPRNLQEVGYFLMVIEWFK